MPPVPRTLSAPDLDLSGDSPRDRRSGDIFFSPGRGEAEGEAVFLAGNGLPRRWTGHGPGPFRVFELGFGTGLNFLIAVSHFLRTAPRSARLDYWAVEAFPLSPDQRAAVWHGLSAPLLPLADALARRWPPPTRGLHAIDFSDRVRFRLFLEDGSAALTALRPAQNPSGGVDAWFLDGFAPARDPDLWRQELLQAAARISAPGATAATFTAAGFVRDGLKTAGFRVDRVPGFGGKRHRLIARLPAPAPVPRRHPDVAVIGAGIAGVASARALKAEGATVTVIDRRAPGAGASGNPVGLISPRLALEDTAPDRFFRSAWSAMRALLAEMPPDLVPNRGVLLPMATEDKRERAKRLIDTGALPPSDLRYLDRAAAADLAGIDLGAPCLFVPDAPVIRPARLTPRLAQGTAFRPADIARIERDGGGWRVLDRGGRTIVSAAAIVLASGAESLAPVGAFPLTPRLGQLTLVAATPPSGRLRLAISGDGYVTPAIDGCHAVGATFDRPDRFGPMPQARDDCRNLAQLAQGLPVLAARLGGRAAKITAHRRSVRATTPDRLPLVGPVPDLKAFCDRHRQAAKGGGASDWDDPDGLVPGLYVLGGLGARGFLTAPLAADMLAARIAGSLIPAEDAVVKAVHPGRFLWRDLQRGRSR